MNRIDEVEFTVKKAIQKVVDIDHELFIEKHRHSEAVGRLHIMLFLALKEFEERVNGIKEMD